MLCWVQEMLIHKADSGWWFSAEKDQWLIEKKRNKSDFLFLLNEKMTKKPEIKFILTLREWEKLEIKVSGLDDITLQEERAMDEIVSFLSYKGIYAILKIGSDIFDLDKEMLVKKQLDFLQKVLASKPKADD